MEARALTFLAPRRVGIRAVPLAEPGSGQVVVRTRWSGISAGTELLAYRGEIDPDLPLDESIASLGGTFRFPFSYGYSAVGVVEQGGDPVPVGAPVFAFHAHQDRFVADASDVVPLEGIDPRPATLLPMVETALQISLDAGLVAHEKVVVSGLGVVGMLVALLLQRAGVEVVGLEPQEWRRRLAHSLDIAAEDPELGPHDVPLVIEASGNPEALAPALDRLAHEGTALVASWYGRRPVALPLGGAFHRRRLTIRSTQVSSIPAALAGRWDRDRRRRTALRLLGELPVDALLTHDFAFEDAADAFAALDRGEPGLVHASLRYD